MHQADRVSVSVLVVEDDPELADLYQQYLQPEFDVRTASNGGDALKRIDDTVDVVLLDRKMPDMSGDQVLSELRARGYEIPVALVTGVTPDVDIVQMPFDEYLTKPIDRDVLTRTVRVLANRASFEETSREFFQLASKKASLDTETAATREASDEYAELISRMTELQNELDDTIRHLVSEGSQVASRSELDQIEIQTLLTEIAEHSLPDDISTLVDEYQELNDARPPFMWKWVHRLAPQNTLPCVDDPFTETVPIDKTLTILFITLLDDTLEKNQDRATFIELIKIPSEHREADPSADNINTKYVRFAQRVWETLSDRLQRAPKYRKYETLFRYDLKQAINAIEYSQLAIRRPDLATMGDLERYESHNMVMFAYADIDLMYSSRDIREDFATLRDAIWTAQHMARIGNWVSTWERELREGDYSSGPVVYALDNDIVSRTELMNATDETTGLMEELIERIKTHGIEKEFLARWEQAYHQLREYNSDLSTLDLAPFIEGTEEVLRYHLASTGLK